MNATEVQSTTILRAAPVLLTDRAADEGAGAMHPSHGDPESARLRREVGRAVVGVSRTMGDALTEYAAACGTRERRKLGSAVAALDHALAALDVLSHALSALRARLAARSESLREAG